MTTAALSIEPRSTRAGDNGFQPREGFEPFRLADCEESIPRRFRRVAESRGDATAIVDGEIGTSYRTLLSRAAAIANALSEQLGARPGPVVLHLPLGAPAIEALLGVLFAGRAYMFLDPAAAEREIAGSVAAAAPAAIVVDESTDSCGAATTPRIRFDQLGSERKAALGGDPPTHPQDLACLFSTSGSTGTPKLVGLSHRAVLFDIGRQINDLCLGPDDRFDLLFSPAFSASLASIFSALLTGGALHMPDLRDRLSTLGPWLERAGITVSRMTVSTLRALCATIAASDARPRPRMVSAGGEPLLPKDIASFNGTFPASCVLQNAMASTETRTYAQYFVPRATQDRGVVPIGWPVYGKEILLLDEAGRPVASGEPGEIAVRSRFLAQGYVNDPELTAKRFLPQQDGTVLFKTGDRGQRREDGCLMFLGRTDSLVKIRGYRVEPEAVEVALALHERVSHAAVVVHEPVRGEPGLAAYVVACPGATVTTDELRRYLTDTVPAYAVPASITLLHALPVTRNGKVDRRALPVPSRDGCSLQRPRTDAGTTESVLLEIWREVLEDPDLGTHDGFFDWGGDSLNALRLQLHINERFNVELPLDVLVRHPTVEGLANWLDRGGGDADDRRALTVLQPEGSGVPLFCIPGMGGEPLQFEALVRRLGCDRPIYGLRATLGGVEPVAATSVEAIAADYLSEIDGVLSPESPILLCGHSLGGLVAFELAQRFQAVGRRVGLLAIIDMPLARGDQRRFLRRLFDVLANLPAWIVYDALESGWRKLAIRGWGKAEQLWDRIRAVGGAPAKDALNIRVYFGISDAPARFREQVTARYEAIKRYHPQPYPGAITVFRARAQSLIGRHDRHLGWAGLAAGGITVYDVPGHHDSCVSEPHVRHLADRLNEQLGAVTF